MINRFALIGNALSKNHTKNLNVYHPHFMHESLISNIYIDFFRKILTKLKKVWIDNANVWNSFLPNFAPGLHGLHDISCVTHMLCHSCKVIFFWCFQLINMPKFLVFVPSNFIFYFFKPRLFWFFPNYLVIYDLKTVKG